MHKLVKRAFTLIELLIVIAIIGILSGFLLTNLSGARERARDARRKSDLDSISKALRLYYNDNQGFPAGGGGAIAGHPWGGPFTDGGSTTYMSYLPYDPASTASTTVSYRYISTDSEEFVLVAELENASDPDAPTTQDVCASIYPSPADSDYVVCAH